jgi:serine protease AprX
MNIRDGAWLRERSHSHAWFRYALVAAAFAMASVLAAFAASQTEAQSPDVSVGAGLEDTLSGLAEGESRTLILTFEEDPSAETASLVEEIVGGGDSVYRFAELPMLAVSATDTQLESILDLDGLLSVYDGEKELDYFLDESRKTIEADRVEDELGFTGDGVGVAVIDSGIDGTKADVRFPEKTIQNVKFAGLPGGPVTEVEDQPNTDTSSGHGTHVASTVAGDGSLSNGKYTGVAPEADLIGLGTGDTLFVFYAVAAFDYVLENQEEYDIRVINNSYGTEGEYDPDDPINVASKEAHDAGMTVVFAGGNSGPGNNTMNPYALPSWVIGVAAGEKDGRTLAEFSSRGKPGSKFNAPDITAPGVDIAAVRSSSCAVCLSPDQDAAELGADAANYAILSGTSMATPHVSGVAALMEEANESLTPDEIKRIIEDTANPMRPRYEYHEIGAGYLDAFDAVTAAENGGGDDGGGGSGSGSCTISGTNGDDNLSGTPGDDVICGLGGDDSIRGLGGNDIIRGGPGNDNLRGDAGRDKLYGEAGRDNLMVKDDRRGDLADGGSGRDGCRADRGDTKKSCEISR